VPIGLSGMQVADGETRLSHRSVASHLEPRSAAPSLPTPRLRRSPCVAPRGDNTDLLTSVSSPSASFRFQYTHESAPTLLVG
jgi:hypothetical protein